MLSLFLSKFVPSQFLVPQSPVLTSPTFHFFPSQFRASRRWRPRRFIFCCSSQTSCTRLPRPRLSVSSISVSAVPVSGVDVPDVSFPTVPDRILAPAPGRYVPDVSKTMPNDHLLFTPSSREPLVQKAVPVHSQGIANLFQNYPNPRFVDTLVSWQTNWLFLGR